MMKAVIDTNILIDYLNAEKKAKKELALYEMPVISRITWMEILIGAHDETEGLHLKNFLSRFETIDIDEKISEMSVKIRREHKIRLPDAIIWSTAIINNYLLITRNTKDFPEDHPGIRIPYHL